MAKRDTAKGDLKNLSWIYGLSPSNAKLYVMHRNAAPSATSYQECFLQKHSGTSPIWSSAFWQPC